MKLAKEKLQNYEHLDIVKISVKAHRDFMIPKTYSSKTIKGLSDGFAVLECFMEDKDHVELEESINKKLFEKNSKDYSRGIDLVVEVWEDILNRTTHRFDGTMEDRELIQKL